MIGKLKKIMDAIADLFTVAKVTAEADEKVKAALGKLEQDVTESDYSTDTYVGRLREYRRQIVAAPDHANFVAGASVKANGTVSFRSLNSKADALALLDEAIAGKVELVL